MENHAEPTGASGRNFLLLELRSHAKDQSAFDVNRKLLLC
jgi:hypothetical protein